MALEASNLKKEKVAKRSDLPHNTNDSLARIHESNDEANNPIVTGKDHSDKKLQRKEGESQAEYNERIPVAIQPVQPQPTHNYLGELY